ncbi:hypothetical protein ACS3UN_10130 [Oscillospiraceae bacterium LTW-04]|nr:hypothetical protein RBH76_11880 [Oscillospiraceae bacterium MB24-C1]
MKKLFCTVLALAMIVAAAPVALAKNVTDYDEGDVYIKDDDYYDDGPQSTIAPGSSGYVYLCPYEDGKTTGPKSVRIDDMEVLDSDNGKPVKLISVDRSASRLKVNSDERAWFVKISVKSVSSSSYPDDGFDIDTLTLEYTYDGDKYEDVQVNLDSIEYDEADDEFEEDEKMFTYEKDDDVDIDLPDSAGIFTGTARKDFDVVAAMDTDVDNSLLNKYPSADIRFFNGNGATFPVTGGKMTIYADSGDYLYEVSGNKLTDRSSTWVSSKNAFVISTTKIGKYIVSDTKLSAKSDSNSTGSSSSSSSKSSEYIGSTPLPSNPVVTNPQTGASA